MYSGGLAETPPTSGVSFLRSAMESVEGTAAPVGQCQRSTSLSSPRRMKQVHFKELDESLSDLTISENPMDLPPRPHKTRYPEDTSSDNERDGLPLPKKEKRLKVDSPDDSRATAGTGAMPPLRRIQAGHAMSCSRSSLSCSDICVDPPSPDAPFPRTTCSTPGGGVSPSPSLSPLSGSSLRESSVGCPIERETRDGAGSICTGIPGVDTDTLESAGNRRESKGSLYQRRGMKSPGQLSLKRCRSVHHSRTWTGKREEVLGAEPGTPKLSKCDTL